MVLCTALIGLMRQNKTTVSVSRQLAVSITTNWIYQLQQLFRDTQWLKWTLSTRGDSRGVYQPNSRLNQLQANGGLVTVVRLVLLDRFDMNFEAETVDFLAVRCRETTVTVAHSALHRTHTHIRPTWPTVHSISTLHSAQRTLYLVVLVVVFPVDMTDEQLAPSVIYTIFVFCLRDLPIGWIQTGQHHWKTCVATRNGLGCWFARRTWNWQHMMLEIRLQPIFVSIFSTVGAQVGFLTSTDYKRKLQEVVHSNNMSHVVHSVQSCASNCHATTSLTFRTSLFEDFSFLNVYS